jgi:putative ABC transport system permease protein
MVYGRLAPGVTIAQAREELRATTARLAREYPETNKDVSATIVPMQEMMTGAVRPMMLALMGAVAFVLLIACVNVANLLLARSAHRAREIAIRVSLGATRWRIVRQLLIESQLLAAMSGAVGFFISLWGVRVFSATLADPGSAPAPPWMRWTVDYQVYLFLVATCVAATILFGLVPALHISRTNTHAVMKDGGRSGGGSSYERRWTSALVVSEFALTLVLLASTGLMLRAFLVIYRAGQVLDTSNVITMRLAAANQKYPTGDSRKRFFAQLDERLTAIPGVISATIASDVPFIALSVDALAQRQLAVDGRPAPAGETPRLVARVYVGARYFETLGLHTVRGRGFDGRDNLAGQEGAIVNQRLASMFFGDENPIGRRIQLTPANAPRAAAPWYTIVGISPTIPQWVGAPADEPVAYVPVRTEPAMHRFASIIVRADPDLATMAPRLRETVRALDPDLPLYYLQTMDQMLSMSHRLPRMWAEMFGVMALIALVLASVGLYALTSHGVVRRAHEIGVRVALGAQPSQVEWLFVRRTLLQLAVGLTIGVGGALAAGRLLQGLMVRTPSRDLLTLLASMLLLIAVALLACVVPARRAARVDPVVALRCE